MKKLGFTLAEVLITLGIIGVVAAITLPSLITDTAVAQIGPKLAKSVAMLEQANETLLSDSAVDALTDSGFLSDTATYASKLGNYLKITPSGSSYIGKDGVAYSFSLLETLPTSSGSIPAYKQRIGSVTMDINGATKPNLAGTDVFYFAWFNDGSLRPKGGTDWDGSGSATTWTTQCKSNATPADYSYCAGSIFENNYKVLYK